MCIRQVKVFTNCKFDKQMEHYTLEKIQPDQLCPGVKKFKLAEEGGCPKAIKLLVRQRSCPKCHKGTIDPEAANDKSPMAIKLLEARNRLLRTKFGEKHFPTEGVNDGSECFHEDGAMMITRPGVAHKTTHCEKHGHKPTLLQKMAFNHRNDSKSVHVQGQGQGLLQGPPQTQTQMTQAQGQLFGPSQAQQQAEAQAQQQAEAQAQQHAEAQSQSRVQYQHQDEDPDRIERIESPDQVGAQVVNRPGTATQHTGDHFLADTITRAASQPFGLLRGKSTSSSSSSSGERPQSRYPKSNTSSKRPLLPKKDEDNKDADDQRSRYIHAASFPGVI
jgi:hypothetical protein